MSDCRAARAIAPELALGVASGEERAETLRHLAACPECRAEVESLARVADELLLVAPEHDPSVGFESRVVAALTADGESTRGRWRWALVAAAAAVAALLGVDGPSAGRSFAAGGKYLVVSPVRDRGRHELGRVFAYEGDPSWLLITADRGTDPGAYEISLETAGGSHVTAGDMEIGASGGSWGHAIPVDVHRLAYVELAPKHGNQGTLKATFQHD